MKTIRAAWNWFCTTPASLAAAFLVLGFLAGVGFSSLSVHACWPGPFGIRLWDCGLVDWLDRWQTLVGAVLAVVAAAVVSYPVFREMRENSRQASASTAGTLRQIVDPLEAELRVCRDARIGMGALSVTSLDNGRFARHPKEALSQAELDASQEALITIRGHLWETTRQNPQPGLLNTRRAALYQRTLMLEIAVAQCYAEFSNEDEASGTGQISITEAERQLAFALAAVQEAYRDWEQASEAHMAALAGEISATWMQIRQMEERATRLG